MSYAPAADLAFVVADEFDPTDDAIYLMSVPDGTPAILNGPGALIFLAAIEGEDPLGVVMRITGLSSEAVAAGVSTFIDDLLERGFIVRRTPEEGP